MSAESLGAKLLGEVRVEGLDELLRTLRYNLAPQSARSYTGQSAVDKLLNAFTSQNPQAHKDPVLELVGSPCSGKKQLLYHLVARLLLPPSYENIVLRGRNTAVVLFDLGNNFSLIRLRDVLIGYVRSCILENPDPLPTDSMNNLVRISLDHLHIFRPQSSPSFLATLSELQSYILNIYSHISANRTVGAIVINHVDAFLWQDRLDDAEDQATETKRTGLLSSRFRDLVAHLRRLQVDFSCPVVATTLSMSSTTYSRIDGHPVPVLQSQLPSAWRAFVTARLICAREKTRKFRHGMSVEEAALEAGQRREVVENSGFSASLDWSESETWREDTRAKIKDTHEEGFTFKVTADGVYID
ncbi:MAG: hypothetical protein Q9178_004502 [Gyalolechia marmorata]